MPGLQSHLAQAEHNEGYINFVRQHDPDGEFLDWRVTGAFYAAVHYVEALVFRDKPNRKEHCASHDERNWILRNEKRYEFIWRQYRVLMEAAQFARYLSHNQKQLNDFREYFSPDSVKELENVYLSRLRASARKLLGLP